MYIYYFCVKYCKGTIGTKDYFNGSSLFVFALGDAYSIQYLYYIYEEHNLNVQGYFK